MRTWQSCVHGACIAPQNTAIHKASSRAWHLRHYMTLWRRKPDTPHWLVRSIGSPLWCPSCNVSTTAVIFGFLFLCEFSLAFDHFSCFSLAALYIPPFNRRHCYKIMNVIPFWVMADCTICQGEGSVQGRDGISITSRQLTLLSLRL